VTASGDSRISDATEYRLDPLDARKTGQGVVVFHRSCRVTAGSHRYGRVSWMSLRFAFFGQHPGVAKGPGFRHQGSAPKTGLDGKYAK